MKNKVYSSTIIYEIQRRTKDNPIFSKELERLFGVSDVKIRDVVHKARTIDNIPICAGNTGYFMPRDMAEALRTIKSLRSRAKQNNEAAEGIEKHYTKNDQQELL
tara:strand:+ start:646 stop:960 length:315 start_codon:yes stop_codon:yes gene_type:complete